MLKATKDNKELYTLSEKLKESQLEVEKYINKSKTEDIDYDENFTSISKKNISDRDDAYTDLLNHFVEITKKRNKIKEVHKWIYFWIVILFTCSFVVFIFILMNKIDFSNNNYVNNLSIIITAIISFCSVIISIPMIITKYLFTSKEDKRIARIILHTQQHDIDGKKILEGIKNIDEKLDRLDKADSNSEQAKLAEMVTQKVIMDNENIEKRSQN